jgi:hypothetical protein
MSGDGAGTAHWEYRIEPRAGDGGDLFSLYVTWHAPSGETISRSSPITLEQLEKLLDDARAA